MTHLYIISGAALVCGLILFINSVCNSKMSYSIPLRYWSICGIVFGIMLFVIREQGKDECMPLLMGDTAGCSVMVIFCLMLYYMESRSFLEKKSATEIDEDKAYAEDDNAYFIKYRFTIIGDRMVDMVHNSVISRVFHTFEQLAGVYGRNFTFPENIRDVDELIDLKIRDGGCGPMGSCIVFDDKNPLIKNLKMENGITIFELKVVICKHNNIVQISNTFPNCLIIAGNREAGSITIYENPKGVIRERCIIKTRFSNEADPLWKILAANDTNFNGKIDVVGGNVSAAELCTIFKLVSRYDPTYEPKYCY